MRYTFKVGQSLTTGQDNSAVWGDIHHKTNTKGGSTAYGYPDNDYFQRVVDDCKTKDIVIFSEEEVQ
jgi:deltex-like protein